MEVIADTNFIISCLRKKIDFISELESMGFKLVVPVSVIQELKDLKNNTGHEDKIAVNLALELIEKKKVKKVSFGSGRVDEHLIKKGKSGVYIASLDKGIKREVPNRIVISDSAKKLMVDRQ